MSLILAIEPNKNQAHQLTSLVRTHLKAELVTAPTAAAALSALGDRIPDVVLTPALFGMKDEAALTDRLRQLGSDASHVHTLSIPILATGSSTKGSNGLLGKKRDKDGGDQGCDPSVFAEQIKIYLQRAAVERRAQASEASARAMTSSSGNAGGSDTSGLDDISSFMMSADELDVDSLELPTVPPPSPPPAPPPPAPAAAAVEDEERASKKAKPKAAPSAVESELGLVTPPAAGPPLWKVTESIEDFYAGTDNTAAPEVVHQAAPVRPVPVADPAAVANPVTRPVQTSVAAPTNGPIRRAARTTPPQPDDWAYFDPSQSAFKALTRRLDEIAGAA
jgi:CheY-like chemotaxis protein